MHKKLNDSPETEEEKHTQVKNREINQQSSKEPTVTGVAPQISQDITNAQPEGRNAQSAENRATLRNAADPTKR